MENYLIAMTVFAGIYAIMALGMNLIWGLGGMVNLGLAGFYAVGAYTSALVTTRLGLPIYLAVPLAVLVSALVGVVVAVITARLQGDYLAIVTLGLAELVRLTASNEIWLTNGTDGISGVPGPWRGVLSPTAFNSLYLAIVLCIVVILYLLLSRLAASPFGRVLRAIREDEMVAAVAGKSILSFKIRTFAVGCGLVGFAGALFAHYSSYVAPDVFQSIVTIHVILAVAVGGVGNMRGALLGAVIVIALGEATRFMAGSLDFIAPSQAAAVRESLIALFLIVVLNVRKQGLLPEKMPVYLEEKR
jgi:branched-chain amino acid transport system permease protein